MEEQTNSPPGPPEKKDSPVMQMILVSEAELPSNLENIKGVLLQTIEFVVSVKVAEESGYNLFLYIASE